MIILDVGENIDFTVPHIDRVMLDGKIYLIESESDRDQLPDSALTGAKLAAVAMLKEKTGEIILRRYPQHVQANMTARAIELLAAGETGGAEWAAINTAWAWVKSVRAASNTLESEIYLCATKAAIDGAISEFAWPE